MALQSQLWLLLDAQSKFWSLLSLELRWQPHPPLSPQDCLSRLTSHSWVLFWAVNIAITLPSFVKCLIAQGYVPGEGNKEPRTQASLLTAAAHGPSGNKQVIWAEY